MEASVADPLITDEDLVVLATLMQLPINAVPKIDATTFTHENLHPSDVTDIYLIVIKAI